MSQTNNKKCCSKWGCSPLNCSSGSTSGELRGGVIIYIIAYHQSQILISTFCRRVFVRRLYGLNLPYISYIQHSSMAEDPCSVPKVMDSPPSVPVVGGGAGGGQQPRRITSGRGTGGGRGNGKKRKEGGKQERNVKP